MFLEVLEGVRRPTKSVCHNSTIEKGISAHARKRTEEELNVARAAIVSSADDHMPRLTPRRPNAKRTCTRIWRQISLIHVGLEQDPTPLFMPQKMLRY
jgi:hypothetical protein